MSDRQWSDHRVGGSQAAENEDDFRLDDLLHAYREACPDPEASVNFMPEMWAKIEARQASGTIFSRVAKGLVTAALGASVVMGLLSMSSGKSGPTYDGTYVQALAMDHASSLEPLQVERISDLGQ